MATLKEHQAAMVDLLANGSGIPASASRLAHAMHDVLEMLLSEREVERCGALIDRLVVERGEGGLPVRPFLKRNDATTPGLNDKALSKREKALKTDSPAKWPTPAEQRVKELENTIRQLKANLVHERACVAELRHFLNEATVEIAELKHLQSTTEQAGCRRQDTQVCEHEWSNSSYTAAYCVKCGATKL